jgi:AhpD family alkylhydroperoxidase
LDQEILNQSIGTSLHRHNGGRSGGPGIVGHLHFITRKLEMTPRFAPFKVAPDLIKALVGLEAVITTGGLEPGLGELVRLRASQINGCAMCIHMHAIEARSQGETEMRIFMLDAWRESPLYTDRERAALAWTESLTKIAKTNAPDADYELVKSQFSETEIVNLTVLIGAINLWNRLQISARAIHPVQQSDRAVA